ncbi:MAG: hypothetical protein AAGF95_28915 [Chloroflexota bacterium]
MGPFEKLADSLLQSAIFKSSDFAKYIDNDFPLPTHFNIDPTDFPLPTHFNIDLSQIPDNFYENVLDSNHVFAQASEIMGNNGWWIVLSLPAIFYMELANRKEQLTSEDIDKYITDYVNQDNHHLLTNIVRSWKVDFFQLRKDIFEQALWAHTHSKYAITVPALVIQVEGIIRELVKTSDNGFTSWGIQKVIERFEKNFKQLESIPRKEEMKFGDLTAIMNYYNLKTIERLYGDYDPKNHTNPQDINRHAVAHGLWLNYSDRTTSTKLFLLLDMIHSMVQRFRE